MGALQRRDDSLQLGQPQEGIQSLRVGGVGVFHAVLVLEPGVLRSNRGIVEARADAVGELDLSELVLKDVAAGALQNA